MTLLQMPTRSFPVRIQFALTFPSFGRVLTAAAKMSEAVFATFITVKMSGCEGQSSSAFKTAALLGGHASICNESASQIANIFPTRWRVVKRN